MDKLDFLEGASPDDTAPAASPEPMSEGPARGPDGKFVAAADPAPEAAPETTPEPVPEPVAAAPVPETPPAHVPITALMDERDKRKALEERLRAMEARQAPQRTIPDRWEDPEGFDAHQRAEAQNLALNVKLDLSEDMARGRHGDDVVEAAKTWALEKFAQSPALHQEVLNQRNPYEYAVKLYKQEQAFQKLGDGDLDQFLAWKAQQANPLAPTAPTAAPAPSSPAPRPPPSLANAPSAGGAAHVPTGPGQSFARAFG